MTESRRANAMVRRAHWMFYVLGAGMVAVGVELVVVDLVGGIGSLGVLGAVLYVPFVVIAFLALGGLSRLTAVALVACAVAGNVLAAYASATGESSTSSIALLVVPIEVCLLAVVAFGGDALARGLTSYLRGRRRRVTGPGRRA